MALNGMLVLLHMYIGIDYIAADMLLTSKTSRQVAARAGAHSGHFKIPCLVLPAITGASALL
eukprot:6210588-Pleurochrysis_carterae.AAC.2